MRESLRLGGQIANRGTVLNVALDEDVTGDGKVVPADALAIINHVNAFGAGPISAALRGPPYLDVTGDNIISPADVLEVINHINAVRAGNDSAETEGTALALGVLTQRDDTLLTLLALDIASQPKPRRV